MLHTFGHSWAQLTGKSPALARHLAAAALGLGGVRSFGDGAFTCLEFGETEALSGICDKKTKGSVNLLFDCRRTVTDLLFISTQKLHHSKRDKICHTFTHQHCLLWPTVN